MYLEKGEEREVSLVSRWAEAAGGLASPSSSYPDLPIVLLDARVAT